MQASPPPPRHKKWKVGRMKGEKYINPVVEEVTGKIDDLEEKSQQGSFTQSGRMDILTTTLGKLDHPLHIRGEPRGVGLTIYFGRTSSHYGQSEPSGGLVAKV
ncbi:hypothetical protein K1719_002148 [Acacia pycnantha]|nr:hypothetical protein K1719_002148 [Acacia pycnantha]